MNHRSYGLSLLWEGHHLFTRFRVLYRRKGKEEMANNNRKALERIIRELAIRSQIPFKATFRLTSSGSRY